jgi:hypothetical protein
MKYKASLCSMFCDVMFVIELDLVGGELLAYDIIICMACIIQIQR